MPETTNHSYESFSWRGSFPTFRCRFCGIDSLNPKSHEACRGKQAHVPPEAQPGAPTSTTLCDKRYPKETAPHKISRGVVQMPCELAAGHEGDCGPSSQPVETGGTPLPCPFCGSKATVASRPAKDTATRAWGVECSNEACQCSPETGSQDVNGFTPLSRERAIDLWNSRAPVSSPSPAPAPCPFVAATMSMVDHTPDASPRGDVEEPSLTDEQLIARLVEAAQTEGGHGRVGALAAAERWKWHRIEAGKALAATIQSLRTDKDSLRRGLKMSMEDHGEDVKRLRAAHAALRELREKVPSVVAEVCVTNAPYNYASAVPRAVNDLITASLSSLGAEATEEPHV